MVKKKEAFPSTFTLENFSSTATLTNNDQIKVPIGSSSEVIKEKEYDPYENRTVEHPNTFTGALIHLLKSSLGTGILAIPRAFKTAGLAVGGIGTIFIGFLCTHSIHILVSASQDVCVKTKTPSLGYAETAEEIFKNGPKTLRPLSKFAKAFVEIALLLTYSLGCAVYVVYISESITKLVSSIYPDTEDWSQYYKLMMLLPLILCCQVRSLKHMVPFSFVANVTMFVALGITLYYMFSKIGDADVRERNAATTLSSLPSFFSTVVFAMEGIGTIMPVENSMVKPQFIGCPGVLNTAMTIVVSMYAAMGFFGYLVYGEDTAAVITQNLPSDEILAQIVQGSISTAVFFTFMLQFYVPMDLIWRRVIHRIPEERHNLAQICIRTASVTFVVGIAAAAGHHLDSMIDLVGALFLATLGLIVPPALEIVGKWNDWGTGSWILFKDILLMAFGVFGMVSGSYTAVRSFFK